MAKLTAAFIIGLGLGAGVVVLVMGRTEGPESISPTPRTIERSPDVPMATRPQASASQAKSLADIQSLPSEFERTAALYARLQSADVGTLETLLDEAKDLTDPRPVKPAIYSRYVQLDARAALDRVGDERDQPQLIRTTVSAVGSIDLDAALAFVDTLDQPLQVQSARNILDLAGLSDARKAEIAKRFGLEPYFRHLQASSEAKNDPAGAWQTALAVEKDDERREMLWSVADTWFETDPSAALSAVTSLDPADRSHWETELLHRWVSKDPDAALEWALAQPASGKGDLLGYVAGRIADRSPQEMFELVETLDPPRRNMVAEVVLHTWGRTDPVAALEALAAMGAATRLSGSVGVSIVGSWAENDPRAAFEWVRAQEPSRIRSAMLSAVLADLGQTDPLRALTFANQLDRTDRSTAIERVLGVWGREHPRAAATWLDASEDKTAAAVVVVARHYAEADAEGAFEWLRGQSDEAQRRTISLVVQRLAAESPESALRMIARIRDSNAKQTAGSQLISTWAASEPRAAIRAIPRMDTSIRQNLYQTAFMAWSRTEPEAAAAFLDRVPLSSRDSAIQGVLQQTAFSNVDLAERLYDRLADDGARRVAAAILYTSLRVDDPKRAERYRELLGTEPQRVTIYR